MLSEKTTKVMAVFTAVATTVAFAGCGDEDKQTADDEYANRDAETLTDENGREYKLYKNDDGTETARYDDGSYVTFRRNEDGLSFLSGTSGLLAGLAAGYLLHRGLSGGRGGYYDSGRQRYVTSQPVRPIKQEKEKEPKSNYRSGSSSSQTSDTKSGTKAADSSSKNNSNRNNKTTTKSASSGSTKSKVSSGSSPKSGFGSAGARSSSS